MEKNLENLIDDVLARRSLVYGVLSNLRQRRQAEFTKVIVKPMTAQGKALYQFEYHFPQKVTHRNLTADEAGGHICALLAETFKQGQFYTTDADYQVLGNKKGETSVLSRKASRRPAPESHNRKKEYILPEG